MSLGFLESTLFGAVTFGMIIRIILIFMVCLIVIKILVLAATKMLKKSKLNAAMQGFVRAVIRIALWLVGLIIIADSLGIPTTSLVAVLSVAGLALSLSIQNILSNLFSGFTLLFTHPFAAGHFVEIAGKSGTVKSIGLFYTVIETSDMVSISIPNSDVTSSSIQNYSASDRRRVDMEFSASYASPAELVKEALMQAALRDGRILSAPEPFVAVKTYGENAVTYVVRLWCMSADYWGIYYAMNENVRECFIKNGIEMSQKHLNVKIVGD